jgi:hypothetical protein
MGLARSQPDPLFASAQDPLVKGRDFAMKSGPRAALDRNLVRTQPALASEEHIWNNDITEKPLPIDNTLREIECR